ncbi:MAG: glycoside hydrolase family 1 protein [Candidatus Omnitrophota bacterium]|nr:MAG: glycoside hydrolase family 1 protein [Candidatus Omnitrophota bacterium]
MNKLAKKFLWGAATSAHQVEGNNNNSDWRQWEQNGKVKQCSAKAANQYQLYAQDFALAKKLNHNAHRLSIEWSRIEPKSGEFSLNEISHYKKVIINLKEKKITPLITLHHFTNPIWFANIGGWLNKNSPQLFSNYVRRVAQDLAEEVDFWITINEPGVLCYHSYMLGLWPPGMKSLKKTQKALKNLLSAHILAYKTIKTIYKNKGLAPPLISIAKHLQAFHPCPNSNLFLNKISVFLRNKYFNYGPINFLNRKKTLDFIGINYYTMNFIKFCGFKNNGILGEECDCSEHSKNFKKNSLGWKIYPKGIFEILQKLKKYNLPLIITENGICTDDDKLRSAYIEAHVKQIVKAIKTGINVKGYFYWSLIDNFEWHEGFAPRFGLIKVDYQTFKRYIRPSAFLLSKLINENLKNNAF